AAAAQAHHQPGLFRRAAVSAGENAERPGVAVHKARAALLVGEFRRPQERAVSEPPPIAPRPGGEEWGEGHTWEFKAALTFAAAAARKLHGRDGSGTARRGSRRAVSAHMY